MSSPRQLHNIALIGFMGAGKSSIGQIIAGQLNFTFLDTDHVIEANTARTVAEIFLQDGESAFRALERQLVAELAGREKTVIATGGGLPVDEDNFASLKSHALIVCLWAAPESIWERVRHQTHRPLLHDADPLGKIRRLLVEREPFYRQADVLVNTDLRSVKEVAQHVIHHFQMAQASG